MPRFKDGIYLEITKGTLGHGKTLSDIEYRNYYLVRQVSPDRVEKYLLNDDLELTGLREKVLLERFEGQYQYQVDLHRRFQELSQRLAPVPDFEPPPEEPASPGLPDTPPAAAPGGKPWWEATRDGAQALLKGKK